MNKYTKHVHCLDKAKGELLGVELKIIPSQASLL